MNISALCKKKTFSSLTPQKLNKKTVIVFYFFVILNFYKKKFYYLKYIENAKIFAYAKAWVTQKLQTTFLKLFSCVSYFIIEFVWDPITEHLIKSLSF